MLHLKFALNLEHLADGMIEEISKEWKNPFEAPVVIFPDPKLTQWFHLRWIKKNGVLANLNKTSIDQFLLKILVGDDPKLKKLSSEMLANVIMAYLMGKDEKGTPNYEIIDESGFLARYLTAGEPQSESTQISAIRLYDLANKLAGLFLEYEISRPQNFLQNNEGRTANGILDYWSEELLRTSGGLKDFFVKKTKDGKQVLADNEAWEKALYSKIFHNVSGKSLLTRVFEKADSEPDEDKKVKYLTLPFLYKECLDANEIPHFNYKSKAPVFIFGLSGMGQFYRVVLREFAKQHEVYAYIQNPCMEFWEDVDTHSPESRLASVPKITTTLEGEENLETDDPVQVNENNLLRYWGKAGRDNIRLWCLADDYSTCEFGKVECIKTSNDKQEPPQKILQALQLLVATRKNKFEDKLLEREKGDESLTITAAPSKLREVEALHSSICKLLQKGVKATDILVVSPNLQEYSPFIYQIFDQAKNAAENGDESFVHIPYTIADSVTKDSFVSALISTLFQIRKQHSVSRADFFELVRNPVVQNTRDITPEIVSIWETWLTEMNVYRDRPGQKLGDKPWNLAVKRMLLARLTTRVQQADDDATYTPYANINSTNDDILLKFINVIEDLEKWTNCFENDLAEDQIETLLEMLNRWAKMRSATGNLTAEMGAYNEICKALFRLKYIFYADTTKVIPMEIVRETLLQTATVSEFSFGSLFVDGISFMKFAPNRIIPVKHLFFLGADADHFPTDESFNTLDLRRQIRPWPGDDSSISRNRYAFLCQLMSTSEGFHISYQNINLVKDSEIYPSPIISDLKNFVAGFADKWKDDSGKEHEPLHTETIPLDETRSKDSLFTRRGRRYLNSIELIRKFKPGDGDNPSENTRKGKPQSKLPDKVEISQLKSYLNDPFQCYVKRILRLEKSDDDPTEKYVEPISLSELEGASFIKQAVCIENGLNKDFADIDQFFSSLTNQGNIPTGKFGDDIVKELKNRTQEIKDELDRFLPEDEYTCQTFEMNESFSDGKQVKFILQGNIPLVFTSDEKCVVVGISRTSESPATYKYLTPYISALALIASGKAKNVDLFIAIGSDDDKNYETNGCHINVTTGKAKKILCNIYKRAFIDNDKKILPIDLVCTKLCNLEKLKEKLDGKHGSWGYFDGKEVFLEDLKKHSGYSHDNFEQEWKDACTAQQELLCDALLNKIKK